MKRPVYLIAGALLALAGIVWTLQGLDLLGASGGMNGVRIWAVIGPIVAIVGLLLIVAGVRAKPAPTDRAGDSR
jgi:hypothetical protein